MRNIFRYVLQVAIVSSVFLSVVSRADSVSVTDGSLFIRGSSGGPFSLTTEEFSVSGSVNYGPLTTPTRAGSRLSITSFNSGLDIRSGSGVVQGTNFPRLFYEGHLRFSGDVVIPFTDLPFITLVTPFTFDGFLQGCATSTHSGCRSGFVFSSGLSGQGVARVELGSFSDGMSNRSYYVTNVRYEFTPVPEPATMLLFATGLACVIALTRKRHRKL